MKRITFFAVLTVLIFSATLAVANPFGHGRRGMGHGGDGDGPGDGFKIPPAVLSALELTTAQTEQIRALRESVFKDVSPFRTQIFEKKAELRLMWMQNTPDPAKIRAKQKEIHDLKWEISQRVTDAKLGFRKILTPEQLSKFLAMGLGGQHGGKGMRGHHGKGKGQW